jgi:large subunit ribosomal protein L18
MPAASTGDTSMGSTDVKVEARLKRKRSIRKKVRGSHERPRLCVFRSTRHIYAQVIDDAGGQTLAAASTLDSAVAGGAKLESKRAAAVAVGKLIAQRALERGIKKVVFDRNGFLYHGRVKAVSDGAREAGLDF